MPRVIVAVNEPAGNRDFIAYAKSVLTCLGDTSRFASPRPPLAVLAADIDALDAAEVATLLEKNVVAARDEKRQVVRGDLNLVRDYVQSLTRGLPRAEAIELVERSGLAVKGSSGHSKPPFEAKQGSVTGTVRLVARAEKTRASYHWQYSKDALTWSSVEDTVGANAWVHGLDAMVRYSFRYSVTTRAGRGDWSEVVSILVS